jgi:DNA-binding NarL/FixJ family response regulator
MIATRQKATSQMVRETSIIRLLVVDDTSVVRSGLKMRFKLEPDIVVVGEAENGEAAVTMTHSLQPDVVLMDLSMPKMDGISAARTIHERFPQIAVVILSVEDNNGVRQLAKKVGAAAYVCKAWSGDDLLRAIRDAGSPVAG